MRERTLPWERRKNEPSKSYALFCAYLEMGADRSFQKLQRAVQSPSKPLPALHRLKRLSRRWSWVERAQSHDDDQHARSRSNYEQETEVTNQRHRKMAQFALNEVVKQFNAWAASGQPVNLTPDQVVKWAETFTKIELRALGEPTEIREQQPSESERQAKQLASCPPEERLERIAEGIMTMLPLDRVRELVAKLTAHVNEESARRPWETETLQ